MTAEIKAIAIAAAVLIVALGGYLGFRLAFNSGVTAGKAETQILWDNDKAKIQSVADAAIAEATKEKEAALANNEVIQNGYQAQLSAVNASAAEFAKRLRDAETRLAASSRNLPQANSGQPATATSAPTSADQLGKLAQLTADLHAECTANADQLDSLSGQIKPQL